MVTAGAEDSPGFSLEEEVSVTDDDGDDVDVNDDVSALAVDVEVGAAATTGS